MSDLDEYRRELEEWQSLVGKAIVSFGEVELVTHQCLAHLPRDAISKTASKLPFGRRSDLIIEILEGQSPTSAPAVTLIGLLKRAKKLAETRNDIAHNPVMMNVFVHRASGDVLLEQSIARVNGNRIIDLPEMKEFADELSDLAASMWMQAMKLTGGKVSAATPDVRPHPT